MGSSYFDYFVILTTQAGGMTAMVDEGDELATFRTESEARHAAENSCLGKVFGYEVFERGNGL